MTADKASETANAMIRGWLAGRTDRDSINRLARYMSQSLRIGGMKSCRALIEASIAG